MDVQDAKGEQPLHLAAKKGHSAVAAILLQHRANVRSTAFDQHEAIHDAALNQRTGLSQLIITLF